ncbi:MAG: SHOCT domain-containing protein [Desulfobacterales bacterium]
MGALQTLPYVAWNQWPMPMWNHWGSGTMGWGVGWLGPVLMIAWWIVVIVGVVALFRWLFTSKRPADTCAAREESALDVVRKRYARGEIDQEQFRSMKRELET